MKNEISRIFRTIVCSVLLTVPVTIYAQFTTTNPTTTMSNVGIGTTTPDGKLELKFAGSLKGLTITSDRSTTCNPLTPCPPDAYLRIRDLDGLNNLTTILIYTADKKFGIGTAAPLGKLHINGATNLYLERTDGGPSWNTTKVKAGISGNGGLAGLRFEISDNSGSTFTDALHIANNGCIGIGTVLNTTVKLEVAGNMLVSNGSIVVKNSGGVNEFKVGTDGKVIARQIDVNIATIPDYVFHAAYDKDSAAFYEEQGS
ncbi:MAG: hypothetical protein EOP53_05225 [Sphingobacteriales bacterium]|nr:MAG: hypothetical protein EOP53_05225 [Sphingobacteriales bacterium]